MAAAPETRAQEDMRFMRRVSQRVAKRGFRIEHLDLHAPARAVQAALLEEHIFDNPDRLRTLFRDVLPRHIRDLRNVIHHS